MAPKFSRRVSRRHTWQRPHYEDLWWDNAFWKFERVCWTHFSNFRQGWRWNHWFQRIHVSDRHDSFRNTGRKIKMVFQSKLCFDMLKELKHCMSGWHKKLRSRSRSQFEKTCAIPIAIAASRSPIFWARSLKKFQARHQKVLTRSLVNKTLYKPKWAF